MGQSSGHLVPAERRKQIELLRREELITQSAEHYGVQLDVSPKRAAEISVRHKLDDTQIDDLVLARHQYQSGFTTFDYLLSAGYDTDSIFAAFHIVAGFHGGKMIATESAMDADDVQVSSNDPGLSLLDIAEADNLKRKPEGIHSKSLAELLSSKSDKYVVVVLEWITKLDVLNGEKDYDAMASVLELIAEEAVAMSFVKFMPILDQLAVLLVKLRSYDEFDYSYDFTMRIFKQYGTAKKEAQ